MLASGFQTQSMSDTNQPGFPYYQEDTFTWDPAVPGESYFCPVGQKTQLDCGPQGLGLDNPERKRSEFFN